MRRIDKGRFVLDPDVQRELVGDEKKPSRLTESTLMRIRPPVFYVAEDAGAPAAWPLLGAVRGDHPVFPSNTSEHA